MPGLHQNLPLFRNEPVPLLLPRFNFPDPPRLKSPVEEEMLDYGFLAGDNHDIMTQGGELPDLGPNFHSPEAMLDAVDHFADYNTRTAAGARPLTSYLAHNLPHDPDMDAMHREFERAFKQMQEEENCADIHADGAETHGDEEEADEIDVDAEPESDDDEDNDVLLLVEPEEDTPDPFMSEEGTTADPYTNHQGVPPHLLTIYAVVSWLHLQFHLPRVACNALLTIFACMLLVISPAIDRPFVTLQSCTRVLGVDPVIQTLPVCPSCHDVFPPAGSLHTMDTCITCNIPLFLPAQTKRGIQRAVKTPVIKYPYLALSDQIKSILKIPGVESLLDTWRSKPRRAGEYTDIFDGDMCRSKLKGPDGKIFFSNLPTEKLGPNGELRIGINLGLDW